LAYYSFILYPIVLIFLKHETKKIVYTITVSSLTSIFYLVSFFDFISAYILILLIVLDSFLTYFIFRERHDSDTVKKHLDNYNAKSNLINVSPFMPNKKRVIEKESSYSRNIISQIENTICSIVEIVGKCIDSRTVAFIIYDKENDLLYLENGVSSIPLNFKKSLNNKNSILYWVVQNKREFSDNLFTSDPKNLCIYQSEIVIRSVIAAPVLYGNSISGVLYLDSEEENHFTVKNIETTKLFADEISSIFSFAQYAEQAKTEATYLSLLNDFAHKLSCTFVFKEIIKIIAETVSQFLEYTHSYIVSVEGSEGILIFSLPKENLNTIFKVENSFLFFASSENEIFYKSGLSKREIPLPILYKGDNIRKIDFSLSMPIFQTGGRTDYFLFASEKKNIEIPYTTEIVLNFISDISKTAVEKSILYEQTRELSIKDGLTNLYNHRYFQEELTKMINNAKRSNEMIVLALIDIDFFKKFNDMYGHQVGDLVLKHLSKIFSSTVRETDLVARYGGEEFVIVLSNINDESPVTLLDQIRKRIESNPLTDKTLIEPLSVTVSIGYASFPSDSENKTELIRMADEALYDAKKSGRNQVKNYSR